MGSELARYEELLSRAEDEIAALKRQRQAYRLFANVADHLAQGRIAPLDILSRARELLREQIDWHTRAQLERGEGARDGGSQG